MAKSIDLLQGTLDLLILKTLELEPMHGWGIAQRIQQVSKDVLQVQQGSLYPALYRLEHQGLIAAAWGASENNRRAKYYRLTARGPQTAGTRSRQLDAAFCRHRPGSANRMTAPAAGLYARRAAKCFRSDEESLRSQPTQLES